MRDTVDSLSRLSLTPLEAQYAAFENTVICKNGNYSEYADLPRFNGNKSQPVHRWYTFKEGFSSSLLAWVCQTLGVDLNDLEAILDPFCGVGTSLLSAQMAHRGDNTLHLVGIERNPFIAFVARTKLGWPKYRVDLIEQFIPTLVSAVSKRPKVNIELPPLSTIQSQKVFNRKRLKDLLYAHQLIESELGNLPERDFFLLGWASIIETVSNVRKDGRALRFVVKQDHVPVYRLLESQWQSMQSDLVQLRGKLRDKKYDNIAATVFEDDGRTLRPIDKSKEQYDLILYSPPYPNNIDYSEVYKLELWLSGFIQTQEQFKRLRLSTFRSHPSVTFPETNHVDNMPANNWSRKLRDALLGSIPQDKDHHWRVRLMRAYADDMLISLQNQYAVVKPGAHVVCVVGNSLHGNKQGTFCVAADMLIASIAQEVGFEVVQVQAVRSLNRRRSNSQFLRESIVILRKRP